MFLELYLGTIPNLLKDIKDSKINSSLASLLLSAAFTLSFYGESHRMGFFFTHGLQSPSF